MAKCDFSIGFTGSPQDLFSRAKTAVEKQGGSFTGDTNSGQFTINVFGTISGEYTISGQEIRISINEKPMMIPCGAIESALKSQLG
jgi:hypothetical protein